MKIPQKFNQPATYFVYAGPHGGVEMRRMAQETYSFGFDTIEAVEEWIFVSKKSHPDWDYQIWRSAGWEEVKI